jgi:hypothetical protein
MQGKNAFARCIFPTMTGKIPVFGNRILDVKTRQVGCPCDAVPGSVAKRASTPSCAFGTIVEKKNKFLGTTGEDEHGEQR